MRRGGAGDRATGSFTALGRALPGVEVDRLFRSRANAPLISRALGPTVQKAANLELQRVGQTGFGQEQIAAVFEGGGSVPFEHRRR